MIVTHTQPPQPDLEARFLKPVLHSACVVKKVRRPANIDGMQRSFNKNRDWL